ncbi:hypothetical protein D4R75_13835 [bacterium]|nr:MAG: hypothetical protein D4R75_13835 [bacterium]
MKLGFESGLFDYVTCFASYGCRGIIQLAGQAAKPVFGLVLRGEGERRSFPNEFQFESEQKTVGKWAWRALRSGLVKKKLSVIRWS